MKNILKSLFIMLFPALAMWILVTTLINFNTDNQVLHSIGNLISSSTILFFFAKIFIKSTARTSAFLIPYTVSIGIGFILNWIPFTVENSNSLSINSTLLAGWFLYLFWYSTLTSRNSKKLIVGNKIPEFHLEDASENAISSTAFLGKSTIYLFYRGNWCPLCMAQIKEVAQQYKELEKRNVTMVLISSQPHKFTESLAEKHQVPFQFLVDTDNKVAKQLGIFHKNGLPTGFQALGYSSDVVLPTVIITNKSGEIIFADLTDNYRVRPEPATFLEIIDSNKG